LQIYQGDSKSWNITTNVASTPVGSRSPEMPVFSRSATYFCPAHFYGAAVFFVDGKERDKWSAHVWNVNESDRFWAVSTIYRKVGSKRGANEARSLADQWTNKQNRDKTHCISVVPCDFFLSAKYLDGTGVMCILSCIRSSYSFDITWPCLCCLCCFYISFRYKNSVFFKITVLLMIELAWVFFNSKKSYIFICVKMGFTEERAN
jgi:hypothetical protein